MKSRSTTNLDVFVFLGSIVLTEVMLQLAMLVRRTLPFGNVLLPGGEYVPPMLYLIVAAIWTTILMIFSAPRLVRARQLQEVLWRLVAMIGFASLTFAGALFLSFRDVSRMYFVYFVFLDLAALLIFFSVMRSMVQRSQQDGSHSRVLIAGIGRMGLQVAHGLRRQWNTGLPIAGFLDIEASRVGTTIDGWPVLGVLDDVLKIIESHQIDEIIIALPVESHSQIVGLVRQLQSTPIYVRLVPDLLDFAVMSAQVDYIEGLPMVGLRVSALSEEARMAKRIFDIGISGLLLIVLWPLMLLLTVLIRRDSSGPAIYHAERVGEHGRLFPMYKFRTMVHDAETRWEEVAARRPDGKLQFKQPDDPRITRVGRWLRRTSLDELPQLFNVFKGDMSLVGPRPELPLIVREEYEPWQWSRFTVPQGMTGWWQVHRRGYEHQHFCTADDLYYIQNYSLLLDLKILFRTVRVVLSGQGAY